MFLCTKPKRQSVCSGVPASYYSQHSMYFPLSQLSLTAVYIDYVQSYCATVAAASPHANQLVGQLCSSDSLGSVIVQEYEACLV